MQKQKGFTIIELIVVIAIIAVLASIVMVNVTSYINKGKDASARGNLAAMMTNGAVYFDDTTLGNGDYDGWITGAGTGAASYLAIYTALISAGYTVTGACDVAACGATSTKWCASVVLKADSTKKYCVDSTGKKAESTTATCASGACPS